MRRTLHLLPLLARAPALPARELSEPSDPGLSERVRLALALDADVRVRVSEWVMLDSRAVAPHRVEVLVERAGGRLLLAFDEPSEKLSVASLRTARPQCTASTQVACT